MLSKLSNRLYLIANGWLILLILAIFAAWLATVGTMGKYIFFLGSIALILIGIVKVFLNKFSQPIQAGVNAVVKR